MTDALRRFPFQAMGGLCEIQFVSESRIEAKQKLRHLLDEIIRVERKYSLDHPESFVSEINAMAGNELGIKIDLETRSLFNHAKVCHENSDGLLDITAGVLSRIWDFESGKVPDQAEIDTLLPHIGFEKLKWKNTRLLLPENMEIDFGGIVKEYAADSIAALARNMDITSGLVNLGGDFAVIGPLPEDRAWPIGIMYPSDGKTLMAKLMLKQGGLSSSGHYETPFVHQGKRYSHIINPKTGWPCDGLRAVSVCADHCDLAGSAANIAMVKPEAEAIAWLKDLGVDHIYLTADGTIGGQGVVPDESASVAAG